jgi:hypothetical protein
MSEFSPSSATQPGVEPFRTLPLTVSVNAQPSATLEPSDCVGLQPWPRSCCRLQWGELGPRAMTSSILSLQEILRHCRTLPPSRRAFYEALLTHGDVVAVRVSYLPGALLWLVTTPTQARLMREAHDPAADVEATIMSLPEARDLLTTVGDAGPATVYEAAAWLLAPPPKEPRSPGKGS